jgi:uncharacterized coiled-coil protein SlyX
VLGLSHLSRELKTGLTMYSHKRSFTGHTSVWTALLDLPFLLTGATFSLVASFLHSAVTYYKTKQHIRPFPEFMQLIPNDTLTELIHESGQLINVTLITSYWLGLFIPLLATSVTIRWTLASLRISVQRLVTVCFLTAFYFCSFMIVALHSKHWTPGNIFVQIFAPLDHGFFQSLRALLCLGLVAYSIYRFSLNATSRIDRNMRVTLAAFVSLGLLFVDFYRTKQLRSVDESHLKTPHSVQFVFVLPELSTQDIRTAFQEESLSSLKEQLTSFQEIVPSTASALGQLVTSLTGLEPPAHGIRHDDLESELIRNSQTTISQTLASSGDGLLVSSLGGPSPIKNLFDESIPGQRCGQSLTDLARLGQFQASVFPYSLIPAMIEVDLHPELLCSNRFLTLEQSLFHAYRQVVEYLQSKGSKTVLLWLSPHLRTGAQPSDLPATESWNNSALFAHTLLKQHLSFLSTTQLLPHHRTFILGLAGEDEPTTAFVRMDGQIKSDMTQLALDAPGMRSQSSIRALMHDSAPTQDEASQHFYSEFSDASERRRILSLPPTPVLSSKDGKHNKPTLSVDKASLRQTLVASSRQIICHSPTDTPEQRVLHAVRLNLRTAANRMPQMQRTLFPSTEGAASLEREADQNCLKEAEQILLESVFNDVTFRDSAPLRTLLAGLPLSENKPLSAQEKQPLQEEDANVSEPIDTPTSLKDDE